MKKYKEILENLKVQSKQAEATFLKIQGAIEIVTSMMNEDSDEKETIPKVEDKSISK